MARAVKRGSRADIVAFATCAALALLVAVLPADLRSALASALRGSVVAPFLALEERSERLRNAVRSYGRASATIDSLVLHVAQLEDLRLENERLRQLLGLGQRLGWGFVPAEILRQGTLRDRHLVILTVGRGAGVTRGSVVVVPEGVVGVVMDVEERSSVAMLWSHPDFRVSAMSEDGSVFGIVQPHLADGAGRYLLELRGAPYRSVLPTGTLLRTSGLGGVFPRGIPVGTVLAELQSNQGWARSYLIRPMVTPGQLDGVMVVLRGRSGDDLSAIWTGPDTLAGQPAAAGRMPAPGERARPARESGDSQPRGRLPLGAGRR